MLENLKLGSDYGSHGVLENLKLGSAYGSHGVLENLKLGSAYGSHGVLENFKHRHKKHLLGNLLLGNSFREPATGELV